VAKISNGKKLGKRMIHRFVCLLVCTLLLFSACITQKVFLAPPAGQIEEIEGYASLRVSTGQQTTRSRVSFIFSLPNKGRIEVLDPLGQVHYQLFIVGDLAYFVVPAKKVYWQGQEKDIIDKLFGFHLSLSEVVGLMSGYWSSPGQEKAQDGMDSWTFLKNKKGWIQSGQRGEFEFEVEEFFGQTQWVQEVLFFHPHTEGRLKILDIHFNQPVSEVVFATSFSLRYSKKTWEEIKEMLSNAR
jgi:outer membrane biogenesis lipoprotein LolB